MRVVACTVVVSLLVLLAAPSFRSGLSHTSPASAHLHDNLDAFIQHAEGVTALANGSLAIPSAVAGLKFGDLVREVAVPHGFGMCAGLAKLGVLNGRPDLPHGAACSPVHEMTELTQRVRESAVGPVFAPRALNAQVSLDSMRHADAEPNVRRTLLPWIADMLAKDPDVVTVEDWKPLLTMGVHAGVVAPELDTPPGVAAFTNGFVNNIGELCTPALCFRTSGCSYEATSMLERVPLRPPITVARTMLVFADRYCNSNYYHYVVECLPRLLLARHLLEAYPRMKVHIPVQKYPKKTLYINDVFLIKMLGISPSRFVSGNAVAGTVVYPEPTNCFRQRRDTLLLTHDFLFESLQLNELRDSRVDDFVVVLHRRRFKPRILHNFEEVEAAVRRVVATANAAGARASLVVIDDDEPLFREPDNVFRLLATADVFIAPYGASETNMLACVPGTTVIEFMVPEKRDLIVSPMYLIMAMRLGLRWVGLGYTRLGGTGFWVEPDTVHSAVLQAWHDHHKLV